jgi:hypothetical protein
MRTEPEKLLQATIRRSGFQKPAPFDFQFLNALSKPLVLGPETGYRRIPLVDFFYPARGPVCRYLQRTHQPQQYRTYGILFEMAPRRRSKDVERKEKTKAGAERNLILTEKSEHERLNCLREAEDMRGSA